MVMGGDSGLNGREFESEHGILDVQFHLLLKCVICKKKTKNNRN